jgi:hypothetical protein
MHNSIDFNSLYDSMAKCQCGVMWKDSTAGFVLNGIENIAKLDDQLENSTYKPRKPYSFKITYPKPREIISVGFRDRVYQRALNDIIVYPSATRSMIYDNAACQKGKGTDFARDRFKKFLRKMYRKYGTDFYVLQCDISGYYPNMLHSVVMDKFKTFLDTWTYQQCKTILNGQYSGDIGFNPGSQMVQIAGISVLDGIDHYIKERLRIKYYVRYMDDFILIHHDREYLDKCKSKIGGRLVKIGFTFNTKKTKILKITDSLLFLGFIFTLTSTGKILMKVNPQSVKKERKKLIRMVNLHKKGLIKKSKIYECYKSWKAHASKGNSYHLIHRMDKFLKELWEE